MANARQTLQVESTGFPDSLRGGCERKSRLWELAELHQKGGLRPIQPRSREDSVHLRKCQGAVTHPEWWTMKTAGTLPTLNMEVASAPAPCTYPREKKKEELAEWG